MNEQLILESFDLRQGRLVSGYTLKEVIINPSPIYKNIVGVDPDKEFFIVKVHFEAEQFQSVNSLYQEMDAMRSKIINYNNKEYNVKLGSWVCHTSSPLIVIMTSIISCV